MLETIVISVLIRFGYDGIKQLFSENNSTLNDKMRNAIFEAIKKFKKRYKDTYGDINDNFLASQKNFNTFLQSIDFEKPIVKPEEIIADIYSNGEKVPNEVIEEFLGMLQEEMKNDFELQSLLADKIIINSVNEISEKQNESLEILKELKGYLPKNNPSDELLIKDLLEKQIKYFIERIEEFDILNVLDEINSLKRIPGFPELEENLRNSIISLEGNSYMKLGRFDEAKIIYEKLQRKNDWDERVCDFLIYYASVKKECLMKDKVLDRYKVIGVDKVKISLKESFYFLLQHQYESPKKILCADINGELTIKDEFRDNDQAHYIIGITYYSNGEYEKAIYFLTKSLNLKESIHKRFYLLLAQSRIIIEKNAGVYLVTKEERIRLWEIYFKLADKEFENNNFIKIHNIAIEYWSNRLAILLFIDSHKALNEFEKLTMDLKESHELLYLFCQILLLNKKYKEVEGLSVKAYQKQKDKNLLSIILSSLIAQGKEIKAIEFAKNLGIDEFDDEGKIAALLLEAIKKTDNQPELLSNANYFESKLSAPVYVYFFMGDYYYEINDIENAKINYQKALFFIKIDNFPPRIVLAQELFDKHLLELALDYLRPMLSHSYNAKKLFVSYAIKEARKEDLNIAEEIIKKELNNESDFEFWNSIMGELEYNRGNYNTALKYISAVYIKSKNSRTAYNIINIKLLLKDYDFKGAEKILEQSEDTQQLMLAAQCYNLISDFNKADSLSLKSLAINGNIFNEILFALYIQINLFMGVHENEKAELGEITSECAVELAGVKGRIWIGITANNDLLVENKECTFVNTKFFNRENDLVIPLIGAHKFEKVFFDEDEYTIMDILTIRTRAIRYCLEIYDKEAKGKKIFEKFTVNLDDPILSMKPKLIEMELWDKELLKMYNFRNEVGLSVYIYATIKGSNIADVMSYLLNMENQAYYAGLVSNISVNENNFILSPCSIILLARLGALNKLIAKYSNCIIPESTLEYFKSIIKDIDDNEKKINMRIGIEEDHPILTEFTEDAHRNRRNFFVDIYTSINKLKKIQVLLSPEEIDKEDNLIKIISRCNYEGIKLAGEYNHHYISDDLVVHKIRHLISSSIVSTNSVSLLFLAFNDDVKFLIELIMKLSEAKYLYCYNSTILIVIAFKLIDGFKILGSISLYDKFISIIHNSFSNKIGFFDYFKMNLVLLNHLYDKKFNQNADYLIEKIINTIWIFTNLYNLNEKIIFENLNVLSSGDRDKLIYFQDIFKRIRNL